MKYLLVLLSKGLQEVSNGWRAHPSNSNDFIPHVAKMNATQETRQPRWGERKLSSREHLLFLEKIGVRLPAPTP